MSHSAAPETVSQLDRSHVVSTVSPTSYTTVWNQIWPAKMAPVASSLNKTTSPLEHDSCWEKRAVWLKLHLSPSGR